MTVKRAVALNSITLSTASTSHASGTAGDGLDAGVTPVLGVTGTGPAPASLELVGPRLRIVGSLTQTADGWAGTVPLLASRWGSPLLAPPSGNYRITIDGEGAHLDSTDVTMPENQLVPRLFRIAFTLKDGAIVIAISAPLTDNEVGAHNQARLEKQYRSVKAQPLAAVFFESFYGQNASCNPLALDRALASLRPEIARYWAVADASVSVPEGAIAVIEGSEAWWRARAHARLIVIND